MDENDVIDELNETEEAAAEPDVLTCPVCGEEVEPGTENCPLCGAPVGTLENNDISGTSIDNSAAIDAMLQSAAMLVEESAALGVSLDDVEDEPEPEEADEEDMAQTEDEEEELDPMEPVAAAAMPTDLTDEQKSQIAAGGMINLSTTPPPAEEKASPKKKKEKKEKKPETTGTPVLYEMDEKGNPLPDQEDKVEAPYTPPVKKKKSKPPKEKKEKSATSPVLVVAAAVVALALGCAVGFFGKTILFPDAVVPECQEFAQRAVTGVNSVVDGDMYITEAYVAEGGDATQCVFRAAVSADGETAKMLWYRVKVYNDAPDTVRIYFQLDMDRYNAMINSDDNEQRIQASMLMNNQQELDRCISEIQGGTGGWNAANAAMLNESLHPTANKSASAGTGESA